MMAPDPHNFFLAFPNSRLAGLVTLLYIWVRGELGKKKLSEKSKKKTNRKTGHWSCRYLIEHYPLDVSL